MQKEVILNKKIPIRFNLFSFPSKENFEKKTYRLSVRLWKFHVLLSFESAKEPKDCLEVVVPVRWGLNENGDYWPKEVIEKAVNNFSMGCGYNPKPEDKPLTEGYQPTEKGDLNPPSKPPKDYDGMVH